MGLNFTLIGQMITFIILVWVTLKYVWPPLAKTLQERREEIAAGLTAAEKGRHELEVAKKRSKQMILDAKSEAAVIIEQANVRAHHIEETSREEARVSAERIKAQAYEDIELERSEARQKLLEEVTGIAISGAEKLLQKNIDKASNSALIDDLTQQLK